LPRINTGGLFILSFDDLLKLFPHLLIIVNSLTKAISDEEGNHIE